MRRLSSERLGASRRAAGRRASRPLFLERLEQRLVLVSTLSVGNQAFNLAAGAAGFMVARSGDLTPAVDAGYAVTDATALSQTNDMSVRLNIHRRLRLTVNGTSNLGLTNSAGVLLDGADNGKPGSNYIASLTWRNLAGRASDLPTPGLVDAARLQAARTQASLRHAQAQSHAAAVDHALASTSLHESPRPASR
jgi:hypothetical protein